MTLGERLAKYRTDAKMSQDTLAEKIGVTRQTISKWETDQSAPEFNKILPLCEIYGITTDELIKGERSEEKETNEVSNVESEKTYNEIRNRKKGIIISISVFLYIIGAFSMPYMLEGLNYDESHAVMILGILWATATVLLIYFFVSYPKKNEEIKKINDEEQTKMTDKKIERRIGEIITTIFLLIYLIVSFITMAWHITWILWIVCAIVEGIAKLIFDIKRRENNNTSNDKI